MNHGLIDKVLIVHAKANAVLHSSVFDQIDDRHGDTAACFFLMLFSVALFFSVCGWYIVPLLIPDWFMVTYDTVFVTYCMSNVLARLAPPDYRY